MRESFSIRQIAKISRYSESKLKRIKNYWLEQVPNETFNYRTYKYLIYDGTYFHKDGCLISLMNAQDQKIISKIYVKKEGYQNVMPWFAYLKDKGLDPLYVTMDGEQGAMRAVKEIWPEIKIQRCLYHIQREGMRWLRTYPKTQAGQDLRFLLSTLCSIQTVKERDLFIERFYQWLEHYLDFVQSLPTNKVAFKDLKRTITLIKNALPNMFCYLKDPNIHKTTNALESFHSRLKSDYQRHRGLSQEHKIKYLNWYCYYKNGLN